MSVTCAPVSAARRRVSSAAASGSSYPAGDAMVKLAPTDAAAIARLTAQLLPSPMYATVTPASRPLCSWMVSRSARAWHGCSASDRALITGTDEYSASVSSVSCANVRTTMAST